MNPTDKFEHCKSILEELGYTSCKSVETTDSAVYYDYNDKWEVQLFILDREDLENNIIRYFPRDYSPRLGSLWHVELMQDPKTDYQVHYSPFYYDSVLFGSML